MSLSDREHALYARHLLLPEVGQDGQARLFAVRPTASSESAEAETLAIALDYLERAGLGRHASATGESIVVPAATVEDLASIARAPEHAAVAQALVGALCAVETLKGALDLGTAGPTRPPFSLSSEEA